MLQIGRICVKTAGRDAGQLAVIVDILDHKQVLIDGQTRRRKCSVLHLEPTSKMVDIAKGAAHGTIVSALKSLGIEVVERKTKTQKTSKPGMPIKKAAVKPVSVKPAAKPAAKKA